MPQCYDKESSSSSKQSVMNCSISQRLCNDFVKRKRKMQRGYRLGWFNFLQQFLIIYDILIKTRITYKRNNFNFSLTPQIPRDNKKRSTPYANLWF